MRDAESVRLLAVEHNIKFALSFLNHFIHTVVELPSALQRTDADLGNMFCTATFCFSPWLQKGKTQRMKTDPSPECRPCIPISRLVLELDFLLSSFFVFTAWYELQEIFQQKMTFPFLHSLLCNQVLADHSDRIILSRSSE